MPDNKLPLEQPKPSKTNLVFSKDFNSQDNKGTLDSFGKQGPIDSAFGNTSFGDSQFDLERTTKSEDILSGEFEALRGERQSRLDKLSKAVPRLLSKVGTEVAKTPGYLYALGESRLTDKTLAESLDNAWLNVLEKADQSVKDQFAIYKPKSVTNGNIWDNLTSTSFWTDEGVDGVGFLAAMVFPGMALKATGIAGKLAGLPRLQKVLGTTQKALQGNIELGQATLLNTALESAAETKGVVDNLTEQFSTKIGKEVNPSTGQLWTDQEAKDVIGDAAVSTFQMNMGILLVPNMIMNKNLLGRFGTSKSILNEFKDASGRLVTTNPIVRKSLIKQYAKAIGTASLSEGFIEEAGQTTIENYNKKVALGQTNAGVLEGLANEYIETLGSTEGQKSILLGAVLGFLGGVYGKSRQNKAENKQRSILTNLINDNFEGFSAPIEDIIEKDEKGNTIFENNRPKLNIEKAGEFVANLVKEHQSTNLQDYEALKGNKDMYDYIFNQQLSRFALPYLNVEGGTEVLNQHINDLSKDITQTEGDKLTEAQHKSETKQYIKDFKATYDSVVDSINELPLEELSENKNLVGQFANKLLNTAYQESSKQLFLTNKIKDLNKDLLNLHADAANVSQFTIEREKIVNRINSLTKSLELSKDNYKAILDPEQHKQAFKDFSNQVTDQQETIVQQEQSTETSDDLNDTTNNITPNSDLESDINNSNSLEDLDKVFDKHYDETNGEELDKLLTPRKQIIDEQNSHLQGIEQIERTLPTLTKSEHSNELNTIKDSLEAIKGLSNFDKYSKIIKDRVEKNIVDVNILLSQTDNNNDIVNETNNNTSTIVTQNNDLQSNTTLGIQDGIQNFKAFNSKVYNAVMMKLFESRYVSKRGFQFEKNTNGEAIRTNSLVSMVVNDSNIIKEGDIISFEIIELSQDQKADNQLNIDNSKKIINDSKDYTKEDKEFSKYYTETIGIRHKESGELIGFIGLPHAITEVENEEQESKLAKLAVRQQLINQRKKIIDSLDNNKPIETTIFTKGPGKLLLKSDKDGIPIMSQIISRNQDLIDNRDIFVIDKGYDEQGNIEGFVIPNSDNFIKARDRAKLDGINQNLASRTFSDKEGNNKGRVFKAVINANGSWSLIPVYSTNIGETKAISLINKLKKFIIPVESGFSVDLKAVYQELGKDVYITNPDKRGVLKIDKFTINGRLWGALLNSKPFENQLVDLIANSKNNITTQVLNIDNSIKDRLETNAYQEDGQFFVQPYIEFKGFSIQEQLIEKTGVEITNLQNIINNGSGRLEISKDSKNIEFNKFDIAIDKEDNTAEVVFVEKKDRTANKGIGLETYIELGNKLKEQGITLQSMGQAQYVGGKNLWDTLVKQGLAQRIAQGRYQFIGLSIQSNNISLEDKLDLNDDVSGLSDNNIIDEHVFSTNKVNKTLELGKIRKYLQDKLPGLTLADEKQVSEIKPYLKDAIGMYYRSTIYLFNSSSNSTAYHEAFHGVFRNMLSTQERINVLNEARKQYSKPTNEELDNLRNTITPETQSKLSIEQLNSVIEQLYYEEKLADSFAEYTDNLNSKSFLTKIKDFFNKIFKAFNLFRRYNEDQITTLFDNINSGKFKEISKQKLFDRNITFSLLNPAFKKPDNIPLAEFLDRSKSIEDIFYYRLNQQLELGLTMDKVNISDIFKNIKEEYKSKAIEYNKNKETLKSAITANVYNNWNSYINQVTKNLSKRKIKIQLKDEKAESTDLSVIPDESNNIQDLDILQVETGINKSYGQEMTAISGIRSAGDKLKLFLSALPIIDNNIIKTDNFGFEQFYDYEQVYYQLEKTLLDKQTYEEQYDEIEYLSSYKPEMKAVLGALNRLKGEEGELIKKQFRTNFFKQQLKFKLVLFEKQRGTNKYTFKVVDSNRKDIKRSIQDEWESNLLDSSRTKDNIVKFENSEYILDDSKIKSLQQSFDKANYTENYLYDTLYQLGIEFRKSDFTKIFGGNQKIIVGNIKNYLTLLESRTKEGTEKNSYKAGRQAFEWFVDQQATFNQDLFTESFNNVENSTVYTIQHNSFSSRLINKLTKGNTDAFIKDLKRDPIYKYLSLLENPVTTKTLQSFAVDGLKDGVGENEGKKYRGIHPDDYTTMAIAAYINTTGNQSVQGQSTAIYTPIVPSEKSQAFLNQGPKYPGFIIDNNKLIETNDTQRFNKIFWLEADRIKQAFKDKELYDSETQLIKDNKLKSRTFYPNPNYHGKNFNGNAYNFNILNYSIDLQKDGSLYTKIFDEFNKSQLSAQEFFGISRKYQSEINSEILNILNSKYQEQLKVLIDSGIIKDNNGELTSNVIDLSDFDTTISESNKLKNLVAGFTLNTSLFNIEYSLLMNGDPAYYKNSSDWGKRFYQSQAATASYDSEDFKDGKIQIIAVNDIEQPANKESYDDILEMTSTLSDFDITKSILDNDYMTKDGINVADAQFYISPLLYEKLERSQGKITKEKSKAIQIGSGSTLGLNSKDYHQQISIMKTFTYGIEWNSNLNRYEPKQIKCAVLPLTESLVANNPLLKKALDKMLSNPEGPQAIAFKSTFKALQPSYQNIDEVDNFNPEQLVDLEVQNMGLQVDNPNHGLDGENSSTRQLKMLFYGMVDNDVIYGGTKGSDIKAELQTLESKNNLEALNDLVDLFANKDERLLKMISEAITKRNATSIIEKVFEIDPLTGDFRFPLDTLPTRQTIELLSSIFTNNVVLQDFRGGALVQATSLGFQFKSQFKDLTEQQDLVDKTKELSELQTSLQWIRKADNTTIDYIEVALPYYYSDFLNNNGQFKDNIPEELLRIIGYRIPTEGAHSMLPLKVVKFLPKEYGNVILLPYEITKQMGADFDFDKIYFLSRDYYNKGQDLAPYKYDITSEGVNLRYEQYINSVLNTNKEALQAKKEARSDAKEANKIAKEIGEDTYKYTFEDDVNLLVDEGYIVSKEVFSERPIEDQLTKEARNNRILDLYTQVLRDVNTLNSLIAPSGPGSISEVYEQVAKYKDSETSDYFSFLGQLKIKKLFDDIIGLKGQSALKVTGHAFVSLGNLQATNNPFRFKKNGKINALTNLSRIKSDIGGKIVEELSSMMAAILDAVKTPTMLPYLNISSKTINVWSTIVRFGMGTKVASEFTSQESIGLISERLMSNDKQIKDGAEFSNRILEDTFNVYKDKFLSLYTNFPQEEVSQQFFNKTITDPKILNESLNDIIVDLNQLTKFAGKSEEVVKSEIKNNNSLTKDNKIKELMSFYLTQMNTLKSFQSLDELSNKLGQVDSIFGLNKQVGPTFETVNGKQQVILEVNNYEVDSELGTGIFTGIQELLQKPIINSYVNINSNFMNLLNQKFGFANQYYNSIKDIIGLGLNIKNARGLLSIKPEDRDKINSFISTYLDAYSTFQSEYEKSPQEAGFTDREFVDEISKLKTDKFEEDYIWKIFGNRKMKLETKKELMNSTLVQHLKTRTVKNSDIKVISLKGNRLELAQKEKIIQDINKYYNNPVTKSMIESLIKHSFKYSGFYTGLNSFHNLIDPSILQDMNFIKNRGILKDVINSDTNNSIKDKLFRSRLIDQFIRNNPKLTKTFDLNEDKGSKLFMEHNPYGEGFLINTTSKHSRATELFKHDANSFNALSYIRIYLEDSKTGFKGSKLFKLVEYSPVAFGYKEVTKLGIPGNLIEINPYFDLEQSTYQPNNYIRFNKFTFEVNPEITTTENQTIEGENNQDQPILEQDQVLESELDNSYNNSIQPMVYPEEVEKQQDHSITLRINDLLNQIEQDYKDNLLSLQRKEELISIIQSTPVNNEEELGDLINKLCL